MTTIVNVLITPYCNGIEKSTKRNDNYCNGSGNSSKMNNYQCNDIGKRSGHIIEAYHIINAQTIVIELTNNFLKGIGGSIMSPVSGGQAAILSVELRRRDLGSVVIIVALSQGVCF
ncbi:hypothetical protein K1719_015517 [Acacia pycnantha]|nr:hypothetical protein K1719_015517 [Acacia pycnantha]